MKERGEALQVESLPNYVYMLPDGLHCHWYYERDKLRDDAIPLIADAIVEEVLGTGQEVRFCSDSKGQIGKLAKAISKLDNRLDVNYGKTTFFELPLSQISNTAIPEFERDRYLVHWLFPQARTVLPIAEDFMLGSFGFTKKDGQWQPNTAWMDHIRRQFPLAIRDTSQKLYLLEDLENKKYIGAFVLKHLPDLSEVQLHSVAGRGYQLPQTFGERNRLPILMAGVLEALAVEHGVKLVGEELAYPGVDKLTFSSSGAAQLYKNLGIEVSNRQGLSIKKAA